MRAQLPEHRLHFRAHRHLIGEAVGDAEGDRHHDRFAEEAGDAGGRVRTEVEPGAGTAVRAGGEAPAIMVRDRQAKVRNQGPFMVVVSLNPAGVDASIFPRP